MRKGRRNKFRPRINPGRWKVLKLAEPTEIRASYSKRGADNSVRINIPLACSTDYQTWPVTYNSGHFARPD